MNASDIKIEWDEGGCYIIIDGDSVDPDYQAGCYRWRVENPEQLYDRVCAAIWPWIVERDQALREYRAGMALARDAMEDAREAYDPSDPKHPDWHSVHADIWDNREKTR